MNFVDIRQSEKYGKYMERIGWLVGEKDGFKFYIRRFPILGNFIRILRPQKPVNPRTIDNLAKKYHAFAVKVDWSPTKTLQLDLTTPLKQIQAQMEKDARYGIRKTQENNLNIIISQYPNILISNFISMWHKNAWRRGFWIPFGKEIRSIYEAFGKNAYLLMASRQEKLVAGAIILIHDKIAYYFHAASTPEGRRLSAPYLVVWKAIKLAKRGGCQVFDFEGIYDERFPIKSWRGFTHFKKSFGGKEIEYSGSFIKSYNPLIARLHRLI